MKIRSVLATAAIALLASTGSFAQATRTWVSGVGDDVNPCSRTAPCKTFAGAISKTAAGGEINVLDSAGYGTVTITKSITIDGAGAHASALASFTNGIVVNAAASDTVIIRNLSINGAGTGLNGIRFLAGGELHVENVHIFGFTQQGIDANNGGSGTLFVNNTSVRNCAGGGIYLRPAGGGSLTAMVNHSVLDSNGRGLRAEDNVVVAVRDSSASGNTNNGFVGLGTSSIVDITLNNVQSSNNGSVGVYAGAFTTVRMGNTMVTRNNAGLQAVGGGSIVSFGNNYVTANNMNNGPASATVPPI